MFRKAVLPAIALLGALLALLVVYLSTRTIPPPPILFPPPTSPYRYSISGSGLVEASTTNIVLGSPFNELVDTVYVAVGDRVKKGDLIFTLMRRKTRPFMAEM
jgi:HlyD family secretion protein